ncbi:BlaR1 peptidase M56 [Symmachiella macrocystis]|uniref:BlaR1 peptidase M56 n=1 Tax=Symmachiella macrocystis TaxID=2527985 RepID=A0A5C6BNL9_9PLAN|nr:M56 family metallopeptidase [Symmachiella macrocystis]TWU12649.1 BlaR1 peptidase M56 [Symmachiella macrocystis]
MPDNLAHYAAPLLAFLATYLLHSTCLLTGVWLYFCWHRTARPALRSALWKVAATASFVTAPLALWLPAALPVSEVSTPAADHHSIAITPTLSTIELPPNIPIETDDAVALDAATLEAFAVDIGTDIAPADDFDELVLEPPEIVATIPLPTHIAPPINTTEIVPSPAPWDPRIVIAVSVAAVGCFLLGLTRLWGQTIWLRRRFADCRLLTEGPAAEELASLLAQQRRSKKVRLLSSGQYAEPAAFGLWRWHIVLPTRAEAELNRDELRSLLAHELAHLVRRDIWWLCMGRLLCSAFAYQPLNFWARRQWQRAAEFLCDEWAIDRTGDRFALANCLTTVAQWRIGTETLTGSLAATGHRSTLSERVESLVDNDETRHPPSKIRSLCLAGIVLVSMIALILHGPTATFALPTLSVSTADEASESPAAALAFDPSPSIEEIAFDEPIEASPFEESTEDITLQAELTGLREELRNLEALMAQTNVDPRLKSWPARIRSRIAEIEHRLDTLQQLPPNETTSTFPTDSPNFQIEETNP